MSTPKRHHTVQKAYLDRFADNGQVYVRRRDGKSFSSGTVNVAVEVGFYDISDASGNRSTAVETHLNTIEGPAMTALSRIDDTGQPPAKGTPDRWALARYLGLQSTRTPEWRDRTLFPARVAEYAGGREITRDLVAEYLAEKHLGFRPSENEASAAFDFISEAIGSPETLTREYSITMMLQGTEEIAPILHELSWTLESDRKARLITSDAPFIIWRKPSIRDKFEGVGITNAEEVRFPLDPGKQLVLSHRARTSTARIESGRVRECNAYAASACHRFVIAHPRNSGLANSVELTSRRPVIRFNTGPLYSEEGERLDGEVLHAWVPRRQI